MPRSFTKGFPFSALFAFVVLVAAAFVLFQLASVGLDTAATESVNQTEDVIVNYSTEISVSAATSRYTQGFNNSSVVITNSTGATLNRGVDYTWNNTEGTINYANTTNTTEGNTNTIDYEFFRNIQEVRQSEPVIRTVVQAIGGPIVFVPLLTFTALLLIGLVYYVQRSLTSRGRVTGRR